jgi:hypothetical protein
MMRWVLPFSLVLVALQPLAGQELARVADAWRVEGINPSGQRYQGDAEITPEGRVRLDMAHDDPRLAGRWEGWLEPEPGGTFRGRLTKAGAGMAQRLGGEGASLQLSSLLSLSERGDVLGGEVFLDTDDGQRVLGRQELRRGSALDLDGDDLVVLDRSELGELRGASRGAARRLDLAFGVKRHAHLAVGLSQPRLLGADELSELQAQTLAAAGESTYWVTTEVEGAPRMAHTASIPIGPVKASVGFEAGAKLRYRVTEHCSGVAGVSDPAKALASKTRWSFDLPLTAQRALAKSPGAEVELEGEGSLAMRGSLSVGTSGTVRVDGKDVLRTGASVRAGGFYEVKGYLRVQLQRLAGSSMRLRVTQGQQQRHGAFAEAFVGAYVPKEAKAAVGEAFTPSVVYLDQRLAQEVERRANAATARAEKELLRIGIQREHQRSALEELDLAYRFDLSRPRAREAYEAAVRGDLTQAGAAAEDPDSGVRQERRVWKAEEQVHDAHGLQVSAIKGERQRTVTTTDLLVDEEDGTSSAYSVYDYEHLWSFGPLGREKTISARVVRMRGGDDVPTTIRERSFAYRYVHNDPISTQQEIDHFLEAAVRFGMPGAKAKARLLQAARPPRGLTAHVRGRYGTTRRIVELDISDQGIRAILQAGSEGLIQAYARATERLSGVRPLWASKGQRESLDNIPEYRVGDWYGSEATLRENKEQLAAARQFVESMQGLATATTDEERARHLTRVADAAGFGLAVAGALVELAPPETVRIRAAIEGDKVQFETELSGRDSQRRLPELGE